METDTRYCLCKRWRVDVFHIIFGVYVGEVTNIYNSPYAIISVFKKTEPVDFAGIHSVCTSASS